MFVIKRNGTRETVKFDKITQRLKKLCADLPNVDPIEVTQKVTAGLKTGMTTHELDTFAAEIAVNKTSVHHEYAMLAARIAISDLHKTTKDRFSLVMNDLYHMTNPKTNLPSPLITKEVHDFVQLNGKFLDAAIQTAKDFAYDYFAFKTMVKSYLLKSHDNTILERPQYMLMRTACGIHCGDLPRVLETYALLSDKYFTHATPTLYNACLPQAQLSSCFLLTMKADSIDGIYDTLKQCAAISKLAGGIGLSVSHVRASGSYIRGTNGASNGLIPMLRVFNATARYVDQGGGKRKGSFAIYLETWHADLEQFLNLKRNHGVEEMRARDLFYAVWVSDLFMQRCEKNEMWSFFCPNEAPGLVDVWGKAFETQYTLYERQGKARSRMPARKVMEMIVEAQIETGNPFVLFKDTCNAKSNQQHLGTIRSSNLCTEVIEYSAPDEIAVCNLASLSLPNFVDVIRREFNHQKLREVTHIVTRNLNRIIDVNHYPVEEAKNSNLRHRPIGIGVQGLADTFLLLKMAFDSPEAAKLNVEIFETIYFAALEASCQLAMETKETYSSYKGSPMSRGILQCDWWPNAKFSGRWDWTGLRSRIAQYGVRNSLLVAPMPTATTSQMLGNNECFEPYTSNLYVRRTLAGEFICICKHLITDLAALGLWSPDMKQRIIAADGSVQGIAAIPADIRARYKTVWEIGRKTLIDMAAARGAFIDHSQSLNIWMEDATKTKVASMHMYVWRQGLKGTYYIRTKAAVNPQQVTVPISMLLPSNNSNSSVPTITTTPTTPTTTPKSDVAPSCSRRNKEEPCDSCGA